MVRILRSVDRWRGRLHGCRSGPDDEVAERGRQRVGQPTGGLDGLVQRIGHRRLERLDLVVPDAGVPEPAGVRRQRVPFLPGAHLVR